MKQMNNKFEIVVASLLTEENLVAEIFYKSNQWVQILRRNAKNVIEFFSHPTNQDWEFLLEEAFETFEIARENFLECDVVD
jgi:hypothetical protein